MAEYIDAPDAPTPWTPATDHPAQVFDLSRWQMEPLQRTASGRWCITRNGNQLSKLLPDGTWDKRSTSLLWCEHESSELQIVSDVSALHDVQGELLLITWGNGTVRHLAEFDVEAGQVVRLLAHIGTRAEARWLDATRLVVCDASNLTLLEEHDGQFVEQASIPQGGTPFVLPGREAVALRYVDSKDRCWWRIVSTRGNVLALDRKVKLESGAGHFWFTSDERVFDQGQDTSAPPREMIGWQASVFDPAAMWQKLAKRLVREQKRDGFGFLAAPEHRVPRARVSLSAGDRWSDSDGQRWRLQTAHNSAWTGCHPEGSLELMFAGTAGDVLVTLPSLQGFGHEWAGLLGLSADLPLAQQRFIVERQLFTRAIEPGVALVAVPSGARLYRVELATGEATPIADGERHASLEHRGGVAQIHGMWVLPRGRFVAATDTSLVHGALDGSAPLLKTTGTSSAVLVRESVLLVAAPRPNDQRLTAEKLLDRTEVSAYDLCAEAFGPFREWQLPGRGLELVLEDTRVFAGNKTHCFELKGLDDAVRQWQQASTQQ